QAGTAAHGRPVPAFAGITASQSFGDWDPPFPIDLKRVRRVDEDYWKQYRTTPKAFVPLEVGQRLWRSRFGDRTSVRLHPIRDPANVANRNDPADAAASERDRFAAVLRAKIDTLALGLAVRDVRGGGLAASRGATDFGEYFTYFSFFLLISALMLAARFLRVWIAPHRPESGRGRARSVTSTPLRGPRSGYA